jgi:tetratricopeptide (TPR) repeat protein
MKKIKPRKKIAALGIEDSKTTPSRYQKVKAWWEQLQAVFTSSIKVFLTLFFLVLIFHAIYELFRYDIVIKPFETPFNLARQEGYTGIVVAYRLQDAMNERRETINRASMRGAVPWVTAAQLSELQKRHEIDVPTVGLSLNTLIYQLRKLLGIKQRIISGDVIVKNNKVHLTIRITGKRAFKVPETEKIDEAIKAAAEHLLRTFEPLNFGLYYYLNNKQNALKSLILEIRQREFSMKKNLLPQEEAVALTLEGCLLKKQRKFDDALTKFTQATQLAPSIRVIYRMKGDTLLELKKFDKAIAEYAAALALDPKLGGGIYTQWARALIKSGRIEAAFAKYQEASQKDSDNPWVYTDWGYHLAVFNNDFEAAYDKFQKAVQINQNYALTYAHWGDILLKEGRDEEARDKYEKASQKYEQAVKLEPSIAWIYGNWGFALSKQGKHKEAVALYEKAEKLEHNLSWIYKNWARALFGLKQYEEAWVKFKTAVNLEPDSPYWYYEWGKALSQLRRYKKAIIQYQKALEINPEHVWSRIRLGHALIQVQEPNEALTECEAALKLTQLPTSISSDNTKAAVHALCGLAQIGLNQWQAGTKSCQTALELYEKEDWAYWCLGDALVLQNQPEEAVKHYEAAVNVKPDNAFYRYKWGQTLAQLKQYDAAITQFEKTIELDKDGEIGKKALESKASALALSLER